MKDLRSYPFVLSVIGVGSSKTWKLVVEVIDIILSVLITLFEKTISRLNIKKIEKKPPIIVRYSGYFL